MRLRALDNVTQRLDTPYCLNRPDRRSARRPVQSPRAGLKHVLSRKRPHWNPKAAIASSANGPEHVRSRTGPLHVTATGGRRHISPTFARSLDSLAAPLAVLGEEADTRATRRAIGRRRSRHGRTVHRRREVLLAVSVGTANHGVRERPEHDAHHGEMLEVFVRLEQGLPGVELDEDTANRPEITRVGPPQA